MKPVAQALRLDVERAPDGIGADTLTGMRREPETVACSVLINLTEVFGVCARLITANADADDAALLPLAHLRISQMLREIDDALCFGDTKMTHRVKDPQQRHAEVTCAPLTPSLHPKKLWSELLSSPVH